MTEFCANSKMSDLDAIESVVQNLVEQGILASVEGKKVVIQGN